MKVTVLGAAGGIGQSLSLLLKLNLPAGTDLALYDIAPVTPGVAVDLSHIPTPVKVTGYGQDGLADAIRGANVVVISAGVARKPGMTRADLFTINASIVRDLVAKVAEVSPKACIAIITNPVNTLVPMAAEVLKKASVYDRNKLFGVTTLDVIRAETFVAELKGKCVRSVSVPVIGGHSAPTILPLLSQATAGTEKLTFTQQEIESLTARIQNAGTEVVDAKAGNGSATLSMAQAAAHFTYQIVAGLTGKGGFGYAYVQSDEAEFAPFFARPVALGKDGLSALLPIGSLSEGEQAFIADMQSTLNNDIQQGVDFVA